MKHSTRLAFNAMLKRIAELNGVENVSEKFAATPSVEQVMEEQIQQSSEFLQFVNMQPVDDLKGEKLGIGAASSIAGRTDTTVSDRETRDIAGIDPHGYECKQTNYDTHLRYNILDAWAKHKNFQTLVRDAILKQQGRDRLTVGFNGTSAAATTNRVANPLLQDVNIGWLQKLRTEAAARFQTQGANAGKVQVGTQAGSDYQNLDELVLDMRGNLLQPWYARDNELVVIAGADLVDDKYIPMVKTHAGTPTEATALDILFSNKRVGGLPVVEVPNFPSRSLMITRIGNSMDSNLSIYSQTGSRRRMIIDNPKRDRIEDFQSVNEAFVIEDLGLCCAVENITYWGGAAWNA
ncbi:MAG: phage major capsid protein, P2 family [Gammaproteobacteria bacterium]|nr:phage major capsid protein, P2 family [Gammaproteobacteria bacterium]